MTSVTLALCLLILQAQVWASALLGCQHEAGLQMQQMAICHQHQAGRPDPAPVHPKLFDCHKCALHCLVAVAVPMAFLPLMPERAGSQDPVARLGLHFYHFVSAIPERPPRV